MGLVGGKWIWHFISFFKSCQAKEIDKLAVKIGQFANNQIGMNGLLVVF